MKLCLDLAAILDFNYVREKFARYLLPLVADCLLTWHFAAMYVTPSTHTTRQNQSVRRRRRRQFKKLDRFESTSASVSNGNVQSTRVKAARKPTTQSRDDLLRNRKDVNEDLVWQEVASRLSEIGDELMKKYEKSQQRSFWFL